MLLAMRGGMKASSRLNSTFSYRLMLPDYIKKLLAPYFPELDLEDICIREGIPWYVLMNAIAYANRNRIYFAPGRYDPDSPEGIATIAHELTHCAQYKNYGGWKFRVLYASSWLAGLLRHRSLEQAYSRNRFEVAAREMEERVFADLSDWNI
jgi:hypothetical protein